MGVKAEVGELDFKVRSHMLLGVMRAAVEGGAEEGCFSGGTRETDGGYRED